MKLIKTAIVAFVMPLTFNALALNITNVAGNLSTNSIDNLNVSNLTIDGTMNAADFDYISNNISNLKNLKTLDLSNVTIAPYSGARVLTGGTEYPANELPAYSLTSVTAESIILPSTLTAIGESALANSSIKSIEIPASVTSIADYAFANCESLASVSVPSTVTELGSGLFMDCKSLTSAIIFSQVDEIGNRMFDGCTSLANVSIQNTVNTIGDQAFKNCQSLSTFSFPIALKNIGKQAFYGTGIESVSLEKCAALETLGDFAFAKCANLTTVNLGDHSLAMGEGVFFDDSSLSMVLLPVTTTVIPAFTFKGTTSINSGTTLPDNVEEIGSYALTGWSNISEFTFPTKLQKLGDYAMSDWTLANDDPENILFHAERVVDVPQLGENVWDGMPEQAATLRVKDNEVANKYHADPQWDAQFIIKAETTSVIENVIDNNDAASDIDFRFAGKTLIITSLGSDITNVSIYDLDGKRIYTKSAKGKSVEIDTSSWSRMMIIVDVKLENNTRAAVKLSRN